MKAKPTQKQALINLFKKGKPVNWITAFKATGCSYLPARIADLKKEGFKFEREQVNFTTRYNTKGYYFDYSLNLKKTPKKLLQITD